MRQQVLELLRENARLSDDQIARRVGAEASEVAAIIDDLERTKAIVAYKAIVNPEVVQTAAVEALIEVQVTPRRGQGFDGIARRIGGFPEVKSVYLMSGGSDLLVFTEAPSIKEIAAFVADKLATQEDVKSTTTHFVLKEYKKDGVMLSEDGPVCRLAVTP